MKDADRLALHIEAARLLPEPVSRDVDPESLPALDDSLEPREAESAFLQAHTQSMAMRSARD